MDRIPRGPGSGKILKLTPCAPSRAGCTVSPQHFDGGKQVEADYLVSQHQAVKMLMTTGLSRTAAYKRLDKLPSDILVGSRVWSRINVETLIAKLTRDEVAS